MNDEVLRTLLTIAFGAIAGGSTNAIAVWMLFHPYEPPRLFGAGHASLPFQVPATPATLFHTGSVGTPSTKQETMSVPPEMEARWRSLLMPS